MIPQARLKKEIAIPPGVTVSITDKEVIVSNGKITLKKCMLATNVKMSQKEGKVVIEAKNRFTKHEKKLINTFKAHLLNMLKGLQEPFVYKLKVVSSHFPITIKKEGDKITVSNFYGGKVPMTLKIPPEAKVEVQGEIIVVESHDKEVAGQMAAEIESLTRRPYFDKRKFQDGIWIIQKAGKPVA